MKYRRLGRTGEEVSVVGLGTWQFGGEWGHDFTQDEVDAILDAARETGINLIDTAECYGDHLSEELIGGAIEKDREKWFVATKFGHIFRDFLERDRDFTPEGLIDQLDASLAALRTDYIDLLQFHSPRDHEFDNPDLWELLRRLKEEGRIRHFGLSVSPNTNSYQTGKAAEIGGGTIQVVYNRLQREPEKEVLPLCRRDDLGVFARVPMASGLLSGKYGPGSTFNGKDVRATRDAEVLERQLEEVERIRREELPEDVDMASWALAWVLKNPAVTAVIPGCKSPEQVRKNAAAAEIEL
jgi:aryl-alcohol dehydrogenase-like predicted oxidoreductase